jgi:hypothetical protein
MTAPQHQIRRRIAWVHLVILGWSMPRTNPRGLKGGYSAWTGRRCASGGGEGSLEGRNRIQEEGTARSGLGR